MSESLTLADAPLSGAAPTGLQEPAAAQALILVIDDDPQNLRLLSHTLSAAGYKVAVAPSAEVGLRHLERQTPDLILCDIVMPGMDGYEVCRRLRAEPAWQAIPLIFLSSQTETVDLLAGFEAGAVDYVTKPFNKAELLARVRTHTELKRARDTILANNQALTLLNHNLAAMDQEKSHFLGIAAHDLKNPLTMIILSAEMVSLKLHKLEPEAVQTYMKNITRDAERMHRIIVNLLDVNRIESGRLDVKPRDYDFGEFCRRLCEQYHETAARKQIEIELDLPEVALDLHSDEHIAYQIGDNLLSNAIKYSPPGKRVFLSVRADAERLSLAIRDQGPGFTPADRSRLFQKFAQLSARPTAGETSTGLGLSIVQLLCKALQGEVVCESEPAQGACFTFTLPRALKLPAES